MNETELWEWMMEDKMRRRATATLARPIVMKVWLGGDKFIDRPLPAGAKVKVVMASRFGDVGITDDLSAHNGYHYRTTCVHGTIPVPDSKGEFREQMIEPAGLLLNIEKVHP